VLEKVLGRCGDCTGCRRLETLGGPSCTYGVWIGQLHDIGIVGSSMKAMQVCCLASGWLLEVISRTSPSENEIKHLQYHYKHQRHAPHIHSFGGVLHKSITALPRP